MLKLILIPKNGNEIVTVFCIAPPREMTFAARANRVNQIARHTVSYAPSLGVLHMRSRALHQVEAAPPNPNQALRSRPRFRPRRRAKRGKHHAHSASAAMRKACYLQRGLARDAIDARGKRCKVIMGTHIPSK